MPSQFNPDKPFGEKFKPDNDTQSGLVTQFVEFASEENPPRGIELLDAIRDSMSPIQMVQPDIVKKLPIYNRIKLFLERFGVEVPETNESGRLIARRIICRIWDEEIYDEEREAALSLFDSIRNGNMNSPISGRNRSPPSSEFHNVNGITSNTSFPNNRSIANDVSKRFNNPKTKFSGDADEPLSKYIESYNRMSVELELSEEKKIRFFHHVLSDHALEYYKENIEGKVSTWNDLTTRMEMEFNSDVRMETIANKLEAMHMSQFENDDVNEEKALKKLAQEIQNLTPQAPAECRNDRYRKRILHDATRGKSWALQVTSTSHFRNFTYQQLLHEFENSLQQLKAHENFSRANNESLAFRRDRISETNFTGQGRYHKPRDAEYSTVPSNQPCWNCEKDGCSVRKCKKPRNYEKIKRNKIKYFEAKKGGKFNRETREILFEFCDTFPSDDTSSQDTPSSDSETDPLQHQEDKVAGIHHNLSSKIDEHWKDPEIGEDF